VGQSLKTKYKPTNPSKYMGDPNNIICRSSWERRFCKECDTNPGIKKWASEEFSIPYVSPADGKVHRYYPDFLIEKADGKKYIIEIKPDKQTKPPVKKSRVTKSYLYECATFEINKAKWKAASEFAKDNGIEFQIMTENQIFPEKHYTRKNYGTRGVSRKRRK